MKILADSDMVELAAVDESKITEAQLKLLPVVGDIVDVDWLQNGVGRGFYKAVEVRKNGEAQYRYFYHLNDQGNLNINASVYVGSGIGRDKWLWGIGAEMIARQEKAKAIICCVNRRGHIESCQQAGYEILGVLMCKTINL